MTEKNEAASVAQLHVGNLPTLNQDGYPGLGDWWVQLWDGTGDDAKVIARVYGNSPQEARDRAVLLAQAAPPAAPVQAHDPVADRIINWLRRNANAERASTDARGAFIEAHNAAVAIRREAASQPGEMGAGVPDTFARAKAIVESWPGWKRDFTLTPYSASAQQDEREAQEREQLGDIDKKTGVYAPKAGLTLDADEVQFLATRLRRLFKHFDYQLPAFADNSHALIGIAPSCIGAVLANLSAQQVQADAGAVALTQQQRADISRAAGVLEANDSYFEAGKLRSILATASCDDTAMFEWLIQKQAWIQWENRDGSILQCQVYDQDEDEEYHILSGDGRYFNTPRAAIRAAMSREQQGDKS